jgi:hypothetical protein
VVCFSGLWDRLHALISAWLLLNLCDSKQVLLRTGTLPHFSSATHPMEADFQTWLVALCAIPGSTGLTHLKLGVNLDSG